MPQPLRFRLKPFQRYALVALTYLFGMIVTAFLGTILLKIGGDTRHLAMLRISAVIQDVVMLVLPALTVAVLICNNAARFLCIDRRPSTAMTVTALLVMVVSSPAMTYIIHLNESVTFPPALAGLEAQLRAMEATASESVRTILGPHTPLNLIMSILIVGLLAGFCEELFFRGTLQRVIQSTSASPATAVWIAAVIFSAIHFQFFGFIPRMLLGAYFGFLLLWSGSIWLPMAAHIFNNTMFVILAYTTGSGDPNITLPSTAPWVTPLISAVLTAGGIWLLRHLRHGNNQ